MPFLESEPDVGVPVPDEAIDMAMERERTADDVWRKSPKSKSRYAKD